MSMLRNVLFAAGFMSMGAVATVGAQAVASPGGFGPGAHMARLIQKLDLTEDQQEQAAEIRDAMRSHHEAARAEKDSHRGEMLELLGSADVDREAVHATIDEKAAEKLAFAHDMVDMVLDLHATLDDEQRATLVQTAEEAMDRHEERRGERRERFEQRRGDF